MFENFFWVQSVASAAQPAMQSATLVMQSSSHCVAKSRSLKISVFGANPVKFVAIFYTYGQFGSTLGLKLAVSVTLKPKTPDKNIKTDFISKIFETERL